MTRAAPTTADLLESGERLCSDIWVRARRVKSDYPADWCFTAELLVEHDAADLACACSDCFETRRARIQAKCSAVEASLDVFAIDEIVAKDNESWQVLIFRASLLRTTEADNSNADKETVRPPSCPAKKAV